MSNEGFFVNFWVSLLRDNKLSYIGTNKIQNVLFDHIIPDKRNDWVHQSDNDFDDLLPLIDKEVKRETSQKAVFKLFSSGLKTQRDEWVYDFSRETLDSKVKFLIDMINQKVGCGKPIYGKIKMRKDEMKNNYPDISKIKKYYNWSPKTNIKLGLKKTISFYENKIFFENFSTLFTLFCILILTKYVW